MNTTVEDLLASRSEILCSLAPVAEVFAVPQLRDPKDVYILGTAIAAQAEAIVTGDRDLLVLGKFAGIAILTPIELIDRLNETGDRNLGQIVEGDDRPESAK